jgi:hypothetical protein
MRCAPAFSTKTLGADDGDTPAQAGMRVGALVDQGAQEATRRILGRLPAAARRLVPAFLGT